MTFDGNLTNINSALDGLSFIAPLNYSGAASVQITTNDLGNSGIGGPLTDSDTVAITVTPVNDGPVNTVPGAQTVNEDTALSIGGVSVNDVDGNLSTTQLTVTNGTLKVSLAGGATISAAPTAARP